MKSRSYMCKYAEARPSVWVVCTEMVVLVRRWWCVTGYVAICETLYSNCNGKTACESSVRVSSLSFGVWMISVRSTRMTLCGDSMIYLLFDLTPFAFTIYIYIVIFIQVVCENNTRNQTKWYICWILVPRCEYISFEFYFETISWKYYDKLRLDFIVLFIIVLLYFDLSD